MSSPEERLRKLEEALLEGRISEETYRELRAKYEAEARAAGRPARKEEGEEGGVLDKIKESLESAKAKAEIKLIEGKMDKVAQKIGWRVFRLIESGEYEPTDPELKSLISDMRQLEAERRRLESA